MFSVIWQRESEPDLRSETMLRETVVETQYGKVRGVTKTSVYDTNYVAFHGIPYARPPVGELRFKVGDDIVMFANCK